MAADRESEHATISFPLLKHVRAVQNLHGLKHADYKRYRCVPSELDGPVQHWRTPAGSVTYCQSNVTNNTPIKSSYILLECKWYDEEYKIPHCMEFSPMRFPSPMCFTILVPQLPTGDLWQSGDDYPSHACAANVLENILQI
jgi:hypothetical protein